MPRFFDDYSNTYLTHDSAAGRKQQRRGWKFRENFKLYYQKHLEEWRSGPMGLAAAQQGFLRNANNGMTPPLPEGWTEEEDRATRSTYYVHEESGERTWVRPGFIPPGGPGGPPPMNMMGGGGGGNGMNNRHYPPPSQNNYGGGGGGGMRGPPPGPPPPPMGVGGFPPPPGAVGGGPPPPFAAGGGGPSLPGSGGFAPPPNHPPPAGGFAPPPPMPPPMHGGGMVPRPQ